ncbi:hypothetical protein [Bacillus safensis]|uniref:hypothetical protein n=1 Tax=Bacillus safensis TaxID=561879 RepID=UPI0012444973|nr:hypothetical protein [Bacillus safensis]
MQFIARNLIGDDFNYKIIYDFFSKKQLGNFENWICSRHHKNINKIMNIKLNSEWITRNYLSSKMILSATVMLTSLEYAIEKNLKMTVPYLYYYSVITCCRAFLYANPYNEWKNNGDFLNMSHSKIINLTKDYLYHLDKDYALRIENILNELKKTRELFSYKFPSTGLDIVYEYDLDDIIEICTTVCELAQLTSEKIQNYTINKCMDNYDDWSRVDLNYLKYTYSYDGIIDSEDWRRIDYIKRKQPFPASIYYTMTEGMVEDYFGAWCPNDGNDDLYNPDLNWRIIFPVP